MITVQVEFNRERDLSPPAGTPETPVGALDQVLRAEYVGEFNPPFSSWISMSLEMDVHELSHMAENALEERLSEEGLQLEKLEIPIERVPVENHLGWELHPEWIDLLRS